MYSGFGGQVDFIRGKFWDEKYLLHFWDFIQKYFFWIISGAAEGFDGKGLFPLRNIFYFLKLNKSPQQENQSLLCHRPPRKEKAKLFPHWKVCIKSLGHETLIIFVLFSWSRRRHFSSSCSLRLHRVRHCKSFWKISPTARLGFDPNFSSRPPWSSGEGRLWALQNDAITKLIVQSVKR